MLHRKPATPIDKADYKLLEKAGLNKIGVVQLLSKVMSNGRLYYDVIANKSGEGKKRQDGQEAYFDITDLPQPYLPVYFRGTRQIAGDWTNGLTKEEVELLSNKYKLEIPNADTYINIVHGQTFNLENLHDHCMYNLLVFNTAICATEAEADPNRPYYWYKEADTFEARKKRVQSKIRIQEYISGAHHFSNAKKASHLELYAYKYGNISFVSNAGAENLALSFDEVSLENPLNMLDIIDILSKDIGEYTLFAHRLLRAGYIEMRGDETDYYAIINNQQVFAGNDFVELLTFIKRPENKHLISLAKSNTDKQESTTEESLRRVENLVGVFVTREQQMEMEAKEEVSTSGAATLGNVKIEQNLAPISTSHTKSSIMQMTLPALKELFDSYESKLTPEEVAFYETCKTAPDKRAFFITKFNL